MPAPNDDDRYDDEPPRRRRERGDDDDYEDDDRPRRRRRRDYDDEPPKKSGGSIAIWIIVGVLGGCLLLGGVAVALLLPAVQKVREAAARSQDQNNLKQITIGSHNYAGSNTDAFPAADGDLSWRVAILPYIEQQNLHTQFDTTQPWDSPANKRLANTRIKTLVSATDPPEMTETRYRVFVGPNTMFVPGEKPLKLGEIKDGTSNTIYVIEAAEAVPWPQPKELPYDRNGPLPQLGVPGRDIVLVAMADGSVRTFSKKTSPEVLRGGIDPGDRLGFEP